MSQMCGAPMRRCQRAASSSIRHDQLGVAPFLSFGWRPMSRCCLRCNTVSRTAFEARMIPVPEALIVATRRGVRKADCGSGSPSYMCRTTPSIAASMQCNPSNRAESVPRAWDWWLAQGSKPSGCRVHRPMDKVVDREGTRRMEEIGCGEPSGEPDHYSKRESKMTREMTAMSCESPRYLIWG
jgi:hypothetical protein